MDRIWEQIKDMENIPNLISGSIIHIMTEVDRKLIEIRCLAKAVTEIIKNVLDSNCFLDSSSTTKYNMIGK